MHVLLVEDATDLARLVELIFEPDDIELRIRTNPFDVTDADARWADVALIDWMMPGRTGGEVAAAVFAVNPRCRIKMWTAVPSTVVDTGHVPVEVIRKTSAIGDLRRAVLDVS